MRNFCYNKDITGVYMKRLFLILRSYLPTQLPVGLTAFNKFTEEVITVAGPMADEDSMKWAIANQIIHLPQTTSKKPMQYFVRSLRKAAANQVASYAFQEIKLKQQTAAEEAAKQKAADTALTNGSDVSNGPVTIQD